MLKRTLWIEIIPIDVGNCFAPTIAAHAPYTPITAHAAHAPYTPIAAHAAHAPIAAHAAHAPYTPIAAQTVPMPSPRSRRTVSSMHTVVVHR